jgi:short-subunit dehydrogenase
VSWLEGTRVVVTGASSGIGREIARQLAPRVRALTLVARRIDRLEELAKELREANASLEVHVLSCDLADRDATRALPARIEAAMGEVDVLVNNAGLGLMGMFEGADLDKILAMVEVDVASLVALTHAFLPGMVARKRGGILNVSSGFGLTFTPGFAAYVGAKHFVTGFTESLRAELSGTGVVACQVCPGPVETEFEQVSGNYTGRKIPWLVQIDAVQCARESIRALENGRALYVPGTVAHLGMAMLAWTPRWMQRLAMNPAGRWLRKREALVRTDVKSEDGHG